MGNSNNSDSAPQPLFVLLTMDCEPVRGHENIPGPRSWERSQQAIESFTQTVSAEGFLATLFVAPRVIQRNRKALESARERDADIGLLLHPQLHGYTAYLGDYMLDRQLELIGTVREQWSEAMKVEPGSVRPGFFSANDYSYQAFLTHDFRQGSCALPGKSDIERTAVWTRAFPLPHHTDPLDRLQAGSLDFFEVPVTSDFDREDYEGEQPYTPRHLRIEDDEIETWFEALVLKHLERASQEKAEVPTLTFVTSSAIAWGRGDDPHVERLKRLLNSLRRLAQERRRKVVPATVASLHSEADRRWEERHGGLIP